MNFYIRLAIAIIVVLVLAEFAPEAVNAVLILLLVGMLLGRRRSFEMLAAFIGTIGR
ncbi:hypothetical protein [Chloroflexus sp.]|uniref:hypothetical protein n=1 Tax=Chloroflexus sp. TaxID=1904827 RepID=UPI002ACD378D|nr:hypothetical protein [Chloroflexus sp.]